MSLELRKTQRNEVLAVVKQVGLDPAQFEWNARKGPVSKATVSTLVHEPTGGYFIFDFKSGADHWTEFSPGYEIPIQKAYPAAWSAQRDHVREWLQNIKREYEAVDLWAQVSKERELAEAVASTAENTPFTDSEKNLIAAQLGELRALVTATYELSVDQQAALNTRLKYLEEAASRQGRIDWANNLIGAVVSLFLQAILPPEAVSETLRFAWRGLGHLFGGGLPELPS